MHSQKMARTQSSFVALLTDVQFELPTIRAVTRSTPEFERSDFRHTRFQTHGQHTSLLALNCERNFKRVELLDLAAPVLQQIADPVLLSNRGAQEAKFCR